MIAGTYRLINLSSSSRQTFIRSSEVEVKSRRQKKMDKVADCEEYFEQETDLVDNDRCKRICTGFDASAYYGADFSQDLVENSTELDWTNLTFHDTQSSTDLSHEDLFKTAVQSECELDETEEKLNIDDGNFPVFQQLPRRSAEPCFDCLFGSAQPLMSSTLHPKTQEPEMNPEIDNQREEMQPEENEPTDDRNPKSHKALINVLEQLMARVDRLSATIAEASEEKFDANPSQQGAAAVTTRQVETQAPVAEAAGQSTRQLRKRKLPVPAQAEAGGSVKKAPSAKHSQREVQPRSAQSKPTPSKIPIKKSQTHQARSKPKADKRARSRPPPNQPKPKRNRQGKAK